MFLSALMSRQFVEMTRIRIEGLLAAFPKLMSTDSQHTFVETDSIRYVYYPVDQLYVLVSNDPTLMFALYARCQLIILIAHFFDLTNANHLYCNALLMFSLSPISKAI